MIIARVTATTTTAKSPAVIHTYRNIRAIDLVDFESRLRDSTLFSAPAETTDAFADQLQLVVTDLLDEVARCAPFEGGRPSQSLAGSRVTPSSPSAHDENSSANGNAVDWRSTELPTVRLVAILTY